MIDDRNTDAPPPPLPPDFSPIVTVPLYAGGVPAFAIVQSHSATRHRWDTNRALMPVEFVIGPVTRTNPAAVATSAIAGLVELAFTAPFANTLPVELFKMPYAVPAPDPPFTLPLTVTVPELPLRIPDVFAAAPPVTEPFTVTDPFDVRSIPNPLPIDPPVTFPLTVIDPVLTVAPIAVIVVEPATDPNVADPPATTTPVEFEPLPPLTAPLTVRMPVDVFCNPNVFDPEPPVTFPVTLIDPELA